MLNSKYILLNTINIFLVSSVGGESKVTMVEPGEDLSLLIAMAVLSFLMNDGNKIHEHELLLLSFGRQVLN